MGERMASSLSDEQKIALFRQMIDAWQKQEWRKVADLFTPDGILHSMMIEPVRGREALYKRFMGFSNPNKKVTLQVRRMGVVDGALLVERVDEIVLDGVTRSAPVVGVLEFEGAMISEWREYYDRVELLCAQGKPADAQAYAAAAADRAKH